MKSAIERLELDLEAACQNEPIHRREGNIAQADLCAANAAEFREALKILRAATSTETQRRLPLYQVSFSAHNGLYFIAANDRDEVFAAVDLIREKQNLRPVDRECGVEMKRLGTIDYIPAIQTPHIEL